MGKDLCSMQAPAAEFPGCRRTIPLLFERRVQKQFVSIYLF